MMINVIWIGVRAACVRVFTYLYVYLEKNIYGDEGRILLYRKIVREDTGGDILMGL